MSGTASSGIPPNDESAYTTLAPLFGVSIFFIVLNTIFLILRFFTVLYLRPKKLALVWDDWLLVPAYFFTLGCCIIGLVMHYWETKGNPPGHEIITDLWRLEPTLQSIFALLLLLVAAYVFTRYSILMLYLRLFTGRVVRYCTWFMIAFITCQWIAYSFATIFQCNPVRFYWDKSITGTCVNINQFNRSYTPANIAADGVILLIPLVPIWNMNMSRLRKAGVTFIFGLGALAFIASIVRAAVLESYTTTEISPFFSNTIVVWLVVEPSLYFITACLPAMHPLFRILTPSPLRRVTEQKIASYRGQFKLPIQKPSLPIKRFNRSDSGDTPTALPIIPGIDSEGGTETRAIGRPLSFDQMEHQVVQDGQSMPLRDLWQVEEGHGIMLTKEVSVTQE